MKVALIIFLLSFSSFSELPSSFSDALKSYQNEDFEKASELFKNSLKESPNNSTILYNFGLSEYKRGHQGAALGYLRKALYLNPNYKQAKEALQFIENQSASPQSVKYLEKAMILPVDLLIGGFTLFLSLTLWFFISFLGKRKRAMVELTKLPKTPWKTVVFLLFTITIGSLLGLRANERMKRKATIIQPTVQAYSGPSANQAILFDINEGNEVLIRQSHEGWLQVTTSSGRTGWIPKNMTIISWGEDT